MNAAEFRRYAMNHSTDFRAAGRIQYNGTQTLTNVCVDVMRNMADGTRRHVANRHIPTLRPGKTRTFSFVVDHEKMAEGTLVVDLTCGQGGFLAGVTSSSGGTSSGGGCSTGFGGLALLALAALWGMKSGK
ncbi:MAG: SYNERG-CTERM sorting domain-containing protein [Oscillospiraceae bacterium]|nr:SYNERG-CTERM sorting domain-containing protein [Oscillospiraceae bacterium]